MKLLYLENNKKATEQKKTLFPIVSVLRSQFNKS